MTTSTANAPQRHVATEPMKVEPVTLEGRIVRLEPMRREHAPALFQAANFPDLWRWTATTPILSMDEMDHYMDIAFAEQAAGRALPFVTVDRASGEIIGSTRFANISAVDRRIEVGWSWLRPDRHRTGANGEAKTLLLQHAFDVWGALRVEIKTDVLNTRSRKAIERLGATFEGVFRQHMVVRGRVRNTAYYSIIDTDWRDPSHPAYQHAVANGITPCAEPVV